MNIEISDKTNLKLAHLKLDWKMGNKKEVVKKILSEYKVKKR